MPFKDITPINWEAEITLPENFKSPQLKITIFIETKAGIKYEETASTLIE